MKKKILVLLVLCAFQLSAQDSIVNYLDFKDVKTKKQYAYYVETLVKKERFWEHTLYHRNRKIREKGHYLNKNKKKPIGQFYRFSREGNIQWSCTYNSEHKQHGTATSWFNDKKINYTGNFENGTKVGIWKYYHTNGKIACKQYFQKGKLMKSVIFDAEGQKIKTDLIEFQDPKFKGGGFNKFSERIKEIHNRIDFQINGLIFINFDIDIDGTIKNVVIDDNITKDLKRRLTIYFEGIKGWSPAISMNRKIPYSLTIPLNFRVRFEER